MAFVITSVIVGSGIVKVIVSSDQQRKVVDMATVHGSVKVLRAGKFYNTDNKNLCQGKYYSNKR
jgi:hypothetical protein